MQAVLLSAIALSFVVNMAFVIVSRTALVTMPIMLAVFALLHLKWRSIVIIFCTAIVLAGVGGGGASPFWGAAPTLLGEHQTYREVNKPTPIGLLGEILGKKTPVFFPAPRHRE